MICVDQVQQSYFMCRSSATLTKNCRTSAILHVEQVQNLQVEQLQHLRVEQVEFSRMHACVMHVRYNAGQCTILTIPQI